MLPPFHAGSAVSLVVIPSYELVNWVSYHVYVFETVVFLCCYQVFVHEISVSHVNYISFKKNVQGAEDQSHLRFVQHQINFVE